MALPKVRNVRMVGQKMFRTRNVSVDRNRSSNGRTRCVVQVRQMTWLEVRRLWSAGLAGYWSLAVYLVVGHAACHITGPSVILSVILAAITSGLSGLCLAELLTRPGLNGGHPTNAIFGLIGEFPAFIFAWIDIFGQIAAISACSRAMAATVDKTTDSRLHDFVMDNFGLTPFLNTYPDFLAGGAVMVTALFIAAGMEESKTLRSWLNWLTFSALVFVCVVGIWMANPDTLRSQPFLLDGSKGVILSAAVVYIVFGGSFRIGYGAKSSSQACRLVPLSNGLSQLSMTLSLFAISIILPMIAKLSPLGLVPEVPLLQAFEDESGKSWTRFVVAGLAVVCLNISLLELSLPLHTLVQDLVREGLLFRFLSVPYSRTDTPFFGCVLIGSLTAVVATLGDVTRLLMMAATSRVTLDLLVCLSCLFVRYGIGPQRFKTGEHNNTTKFTNRSKHTKRRPKQQRNGDGLQTISRSVSNHMNESIHTNNQQQDETVPRRANHGSNIEGVDAAERRKPSSFSRFFNCICSNVSIWKWRNHNYENVVDTNPHSTMYWGEPEGIGNQILTPNQPLDTFSTRPTVGGAAALLTPSSFVVSEDSNNQNEEVCTETESSPSGYETDSSSDGNDLDGNRSDGDGDDDTDIDVVIDEYRSSNSLSSIGQPSRNQRDLSNPSSVQQRRRSSIRPRPTQRTSNCVFLSTILLMAAFGTQYFIIDSMQSTTITATVIMNLGLSVTVFALILLIAKQPQDRPPGIENTFLVPLTPWTQFFAIFLNLSLVAHVVPETWPEMLTWSLIGCIVYLSYGIRHSTTNDASDSITSFWQNPRRPTHLTLTPIIPESESGSGAATIRFSEQIKYNEKTSR